MVYSLAITITHYTPAPSCPSSPPLSLSLSLIPYSFCVVPSVSLFSSSYRFAVFSISLSSFFLFAFLSSLSLFVLRLFCRVGHGLFRNCFRSFLLLLRLQRRISRAFRYRVLYRDFSSSSLSFFFSFFILFSLLSGTPVGIYFSVRRIFFPELSLLSLSLHFLLFLREEWMSKFMKQN